jgi:hypothetical protein
LIRTFFVALVVLVLVSCGAQQSAAPDASPDEQTTTQRSAVEDIAETTAAPTTALAEPEEEPLREGPASTNTLDAPAVGTNGMVSSAHPLATEAGLEILADGGNAFDGYGAVMIHDAEKGETRYLDAGSRFPRLRRCEHLPPARAELRGQPLRRARRLRPGER